MHRIHRPELRPWISTEKISANEFLELCSRRNVTGTVDEANRTFAECLEDWGIRATADDIRSVAADCDPEQQLSCPEESVLLEGNMSRAEAGDWLSDVSLESVKFLQQHPGSRAWTVDYSRLCDSRSSAPPTATNPVPPPDPLSKGLEAVLVVQVFRPTVGTDVKKSPIVVDMEVEVLSFQTLLHLRRSISCPSDLSSVPSVACHTSSYFFIGDTFYNDTRSGCSDHSEPIIAWSKEPGRGVGPFRSEDMCSARLADLQLQLGYPYLFVHQGDCEHWIVFRDMRVLLKGDSGLSEYPKLRPVARRLQIRCDLCRTNVARVTTRNNVRVPTDPSFFCDECHRVFNLDSNKQPIASFQSQTYIDKSVTF